MKNFSKTIASVSLSLLTITAMAQVTSKAVPSIKVGHPRTGAKLAKHEATRHTLTGGSAASFELFYPSTDAALAPAYSTSLGWFVDQINGRFTKDDTNAAAPYPNYNLVTKAAVAFDTMYDDNLNTYNAHNLTVDTVWVVGLYQNTSGKNDTLLFSINAVGPTGLPLVGSVYTTVTVPLYPDVTFTTVTPSGPAITRISGGDYGTSSDSLFTIPGLANFTLPAGNIHFAVFVTFLGSKLDTFDLGYGFPLQTCSGGSCGSYDYCSPHTYVGDVYTDTRSINVNSYAWMFAEYYSNISTQQPADNGTILSFYQANNYEWNTCLGGCTNDTMFFYEQDYAIQASVSINTSAGINNIASGLTGIKNYPNPFNKETTISYTLTNASDVTFSVCDVTGRELIKNVYTNSTPGQHTITLEANSFSPGVYFYSFDINGSRVTNKMVVTQ